MSHRQRASTLRHSWVSERLFLWQQKTYFLIQTVRFRKGYSAAVSRFPGGKRKLSQTKEERKKTSEIHFVFSAPRTSHSEGSCYLSIPDLVQGSELMACLPFAWISLKMWGTKRELSGSICSKYWLAKGVEGVGKNLLVPLLVPRTFPSPCPILPAAPSRTRWNSGTPQGPQGQHFHTMEVKWLLSQWPYDKVSLTLATAWHDGLKSTKSEEAACLGSNPTLSRLCNLFQIQFPHL